MTTDSNTRTDSSTDSHTDSHTDDHTDTGTDPRALVLAAAAQARDRIERVRAADLDRPTPCDGWTVRDLLSHLLAVADRIPALLRGGDPRLLPRTVDGVADDGWAAAWTAREPELAAALAEPDVLGRTVTHPAGPMPAAGAMLAYTSELCTHAWDLAAALGDTTGFDDRLAEPCLAPLRAFLPPEVRGADEVPFGAVVPVDDDRPATERLVAWYGRDPRWRP
ncbi:TIGR03086 family metal-binding protein [Nocardioides dongxiaopingii]|uniref:TIGR03086 family metal-binding protein n=1 Tax=Nocardioides sp. S-1144 TaxID=2582905 RepID=UPI001651F224|nr:TIGR03086 family metal-binding protein [Nocardioides sp. S-1144]